MTDQNDDGLGSYYILNTANRMRFVLSVDEGDRLATVLAGLHDWGPGPTPPDALMEPMFLTFTDRSGSEGVIRAAQIESLYTCTPASRANDKAEREAFKAAKDWTEDE